MAPTPETVALVALLRGARRSWQQYASAVSEAGSAHAVLQEEHGLLAGDLLQDARREIDAWDDEGIATVGMLDPDYPPNLAGAHDRPPLIFIAGELSAADDRSVAVIGSRRASAKGLRAARAIGRHLVEREITVVSGLAAGIDTATHREALTAGGRTVAVIGTGLRHCYPPVNDHLQREIARRCAVVSQFWPESPASRHSFPMRNAVMSGLSLATVIVEASETSGTRIQARRALAQGRPVLLLAWLLDQGWARELSASPGTHVVHTPAEITDVVNRLGTAGTLTA